LKNLVCYLFDLLAGHRAFDAMPCPLPGLSQIDTAEQQGKLLLTERYFRFSRGGFRPAEPALL
jgi:hypothetical protein